MSRLTDEELAVVPLIGCGTGTYGDIDPGVRRLVFLLNGYSFETTDSGDGISKMGDPERAACAMDCPNVTILVRPPSRLIEEADRLFETLKKHGVLCAPVGGQAPCIQASYDPAIFHVDDLFGVISLFNVEDSMLTSDHQVVDPWVDAIEHAKVCTAHGTADPTGICDHVREMVAESRRVLGLKPSRTLAEEPHPFEADYMGRQAGPPEETCTICAKDPRNLIHTVKRG